MGGHGHYQHIVLFIMSLLWLTASLFTVGLPFMLSPPQFLCGDQQCEEVDACKGKELVYAPNSPKNMVVEWGLVCERGYAVPLIESFLMFGNLLGCMLCGWVANDYGRKSVLLFCQIGFVCATAACVVIPSVEFMYVVALTAGFFVAGMTNSNFVILSEIVDNDFRSLYTGISFAAWGFGTAVMAYLSIYLTDWREMSILITCVSLASVFSILWLDESPRFLATTQGKFEAARAVLQRMSKYNGKPSFQDVLEGERVIGYQEDPTKALPSSPKPVGNEASSRKLNFVNTSNGLVTVTDPHSATTEQFSFCDLLRYASLRTKFLLITIIWISVTTSYYGIIFCLNSYIGNMYVNGIVLGLAEVPSDLLTSLVLNKLGRQSSMKWLLLISGFACWTGEIADLLDNQVLQTATLFVSRFAVTALFLIVYVYTAEAFPTCVRSLVIGACNSLGGLGALFSPYVMSLSELIGLNPLLLLGTLLTASCILVCDLPETLGLKLDDYIEEMKSTVEMSVIISAGTHKSKRTFEQLNEAG